MDKTPSLLRGVFRMKVRTTRHMRGFVLKCKGGH